MRQKRAKSYKKQISVYLHAFKFREPFQVLLDDQIVLEGERTSFNVDKALKRTIQGEVKPMITQCCMQSLYKTKNQKAIDLAKQYERRRCNHLPSDPVSPSECIESVVSVNGENKHRYVVATQYKDLRRSLRQTPGVPLIYINRSVMVMEPLSDASREFSETYETAKLRHGLNETKSGISLNETKDAVPILKKRKGPKGPNPLSVKKRKTATPITENPLKKSHRKRRHGTRGTTERAGESLLESI